MATDERRTAELVGRAETRLGQVEACDDQAARQAALDLVRAMLELYGEGLARITEIATRAGGDAVRVELADDQLVSHLLLLHGLHPLDPRARVERALEAVRPRLGGAAPELVGVDGEVARLRLPAAGCRSSAAAARAALEDAVRDAAPELERVEIEEPAPPPVVVPLESLRSPA